VIDSETQERPEREQKKAMRHFREVKGKPGVLVEVHPKTGKDLTGREHEGPISESKRLEFTPVKPKSESIVESFKKMGMSDEAARIAADF
jgi:hypothetical protein